MAKNQKAPKIERPCIDCSHLHEGIVCMETGCECKVSRVADIPDAGTTEMVDLKADDTPDLSFTPAEAAGAPAQAPAIPLQERIANLLEDFAVENSIPVGCEVVIAGKCFSWNGTQMAEVAEDAPAPPAPAVELSDDDKAKLRAFVAEQAEVKELPDGSIMLPVRIEPEQVEILKAWADGAGEHWIAYAQKTVDMGLNAVINGGAVAG